MREGVLIPNLWGLQNQLLSFSGNLWGIRFIQPPPVVFLSLVGNLFVTKPTLRLPKKTVKHLKKTQF
jgi:hypothetical protein